jgi:tetratricopeptide (TPR) repeat protein
LRDADALKQDGNNHFRTGEWEQALASYRTALGRLPKRKEAPKSQATPSRPDSDSENETERDEATRKEDTDDTSDVEAEAEPKDPWEDECAKARAVLNSNIAACYVKLGDHSEVVKACTESLKDDDEYVKALQRRAASNDKLGTWSSLTSAQEDYEKLLTLLPPSSTQHKEAKRALQAVKPRAEAAQKKEMAETMEKLKGVGNNILGYFGLSTDNFKFEPNGQGGYSVNFQR